MTWPESPLEMFKRLVREQEAEGLRRNAQRAACMFTVTIPAQGFEWWRPKVPAGVVLDALHLASDVDPRSVVAFDRRGIIVPREQDRFVGDGGAVVAEFRFSGRPGTVIRGGVFGWAPRGMRS